jgi:hypothetical protein
MDPKDLILLFFQQASEASIDPAERCLVHMVDIILFSLCNMVYRGDRQALPGASLASIMMAHQDAFSLRKSLS